MKSEHWVLLILGGLLLVIMARQQSATVTVQKEAQAPSEPTADDILTLPTTADVLMGPPLPTEPTPAQILGLALTENKGIGIAPGILKP